MALKGEGAPAFGGSSSNYEGGGVGGKFRRRVFRRSSQATPYDRPPTATRNPSWLSKLVVDPASKLLNFGARRFFASVFPNKRLPTPPTAQPPEEEQERRNGLPETALDAKIDTGVQEPVADVCGTSTSNNDNCGLPELEQLLKQKTFTRSEIDRLTLLLKSRAIDLPVNDDRHVELNPSVQDSGRHQEFPTTSIINKSESLGAHVSVLDNPLTTGEQNMQRFDDQIASPAQLAKAYMSSRPATVSPSKLGLRAQIPWEDSVPPSNSPYTSKSRPSPLPVKSSGYSGVPENGFTTPRSRGRSAIYNMARTPYSRFLPDTHQKVSVTKNYGDSRPLLLASGSAMENGGKVASKPVALKRRSGVLDDDIGSIGPIRRIRQKHNLLPHGKSISGKVLGSDLTNSPKRPFMGNADNRGASTSSASYARVPRESSEMAAKILEQLEKMTPKEKSLESKLAAAREGSAFRLSPHMLHGQALRSMEDLDASKLLRNSHKDPKLVDQAVNPLPNSHEFSTQKKVSVEEQGPVKSVHPEDKLIPDRIIQGSDNSSRADGAMLSFPSQPPQKKHPFKMSAQEDFIEMDDDCCNENEPASAGKGLDEPLRDGKVALNVDKTFDRSPVSLGRPAATPLFNGTELEEGNVTAGENNTTGFNFPTSFAPNTNSQKVFNQSTKVGDSLLFNSGTATTRDKPMSVESKVETSSSSKNVFPVTTNAVVGVTESDTSNKNNPELDNTVNGNLVKPPSLAFNSIASNNIISVDDRSSNLASNDGPPTSSVSLSFSSSAPASVSLENPSFTSSLSNMTSSTVATTGTSVLSDSALVPANGASSSFPDTVSVHSFSKNLFSPPSKIVSREATDVKGEKMNGLGNFSNSSTVSTFSVTSNGSSIFGVGTFPSSAVNLQWTSSAIGTSGQKESSLTGSSSGNVSLSTPVHFGSSSSATVFGLSGVTPSSSFFNSSAPTKSEDTTQSSASASASNPVNSVNGSAAEIFKFGGGGTTQSSASASASNPVNSVNGSAAETFKFGGGGATSSEGNASGSTTTASLGTFQFGLSSATPTSSSSSPSSSLFNFNAGSVSSSAISSGPNSAGVFGFGTGSSSSATSVSVTSSSMIPVTSSSTASAIFSFGTSASVPSSDSNQFSSSGGNSSSFVSSLQAPRSTLGSNFSMPSSTGFSFGGSSPGFGTSNTSMVFGSTTGVPSNPTFTFSTAASPLPSAGTQNAFGNSASSPFTTSPGNNDQMSAEDCMAEDPIQTAPTAPVFGQPLVSPSPPGLTFGSTAPSPLAPFQFGSQQGQIGQQNPSPFQASGSLDFSAGGSFSLGSGGDKSGRKIVKVSRNRNRKMR